MKRSSISALAIAATLFATAANAELLANSDLSLDPVEQATQVDAMIAVVFEPLEPKIPGIVDKMVDIADCESNRNQLRPDGSLKENSDPDSSAAGVFQILLITHRPDYERKNLNPVEVADNIRFARYMVERKHRRGRENVYEDWECA
jgi:hypothetical protein